MVLSVSTKTFKSATFFSPLNSSSPANSSGWDRCFASIDGVALGFHDARFTSPNRLPWRDPNAPGNHLHPMTRVDVETWRFQKKHIGHDGSGVLPKGTRLVKQVFGSFWFHLFGSIYWFHLFLVPSSWFHLFGKCKFHHIT